jgi:hypothetical protein
LGLVGIDGHQAFSAFTGVDCAYRRQGLACALTLLTIRYAHRRNPIRIEVCNDSRKRAMFPLQVKLGYERISGCYDYIIALLISISFNTEVVFPLDLHARFDQ